MSRSRIPLYLTAVVLGAIAMLLVRDPYGAHLLLGSFAICNALGLYIAYESKALKPGIRALWGEFRPMVATKPTIARAAFFTSVWFMAGAGGGLLARLVQAAER